MPTYTQLTDPAEIEAAQRTLEGTIRAAATGPFTLRLGHHGGSLDREVWYIARRDLWHNAHRETNRWWNGFGFGDPSQSRLLPIRAEVNPSFDGSRRSAGAFLRDEAGAIWLAHNGRLGGSRKGLDRSGFLEFPGNEIVAVDGQRYILIARVDGEDLVDELAAFVSRVQAFKAALADPDEPDDEDEDEDEDGDGAGKDAPWPVTAVVPRDPQHRTELLHWLVDALRLAHAHSPTCWALTRRSGPRLRLLVGRTVAFELHIERVGVGLQLNRLLAEVPSDRSGQDFPFVDVETGVFRRYSVAAFRAAREQLWPAAEAFIGRAATAFQKTPFRRYHDPRLVEELEQLLDTELPRPSWASTAPPNRGDSSDAIKSPKHERSVLDFAVIRGSLADAKLRFPDELLASYLLALQAKRFVILSGISGTGKTQLALAVARAFQANPHLPGLEAGDELSSADHYELRVHPYMLKHRALVVPARLVRIITAAGIPEQVEVRYGERSIALTWSPGPTQSQLSLRGEFNTWFRETFKPKEPLHLYLESQDPPILRISPTRISPTPAGPTTPTTPEPTYAVVAVRPDWTDNRGLLGYANPITRDYHTTPFLRLLLAAHDEVARAARENRPPRPYFLILDEMNLARVEHYFSDFLSCLESGEPLHLHDDPDIAEGQTESAIAVPMQLAIPPNLFFTGTVNVDETTYMFSPKVLDRAFVLEFNDVDLDRLAATGGEGEDDDGDGDDSALRLDRFDGALDLRGKPDRGDYQQVAGLLGGALHRALTELNARLQADHRHFGYRVANEIARFLVLAHEQAGGGADGLWHALDVAILAKVLPKLHGTQHELQELLEALLAFAVDPQAPASARAREGEWVFAHGRISPATGTVSGSPALPRSAAKLWRMLRRVRLQGYVSFIE